MAIDNMDVVSTYNKIVRDILVNDEIKYTILKMIALYLRVRSFSLATCITTKYRLTNIKGKQKALHKNLRSLPTEGDNREPRISFYFSVKRRWRMEGMVRGLGVEGSIDG